MEAATQLFGASEKSAVVLDIGTRFTKCGYASEHQPRVVLPTNFPETAVSFDLQQWKKTLHLFLNDIFYGCLQSIASERRVVVCDSFVCTDAMKEAFYHVCFEIFKVPSVLFVPSEDVCLLPYRSTTSLVVDCGYSECRVVPVVDGYRLEHCGSQSPVGTKRVLQNLYALLGGTTDVTDIAQLETIWANACCINATGIPLPDDIPDSLMLWNDSGATKTSTTILPDTQVSINSKVLLVPAYTRIAAGEIMFNAPDKASLPDLILECLLRCPLDVRKRLAQSIMLTGGSVHATGFHFRLIKELKQRLVNYKEFDSLNLHFNVMELKFPARHSSWVGGSVIGSLEGFGKRFSQHKPGLSQNLR